LVVADLLAAGADRQQAARLLHPIEPLAQLGDESLAVFFRLLTLGDVPGDAVDRYQVARGVKDRREELFGPDQAAVLVSPTKNQNSIRRELAP
jgi:hypothetical protein